MRYQLSLSNVLQYMSFDLVLEIAILDHCLKTLSFQNSIKPQSGLSEPNALSQMHLDNKGLENYVFQNHNRIYREQIKQGLIKMLSLLFSEFWRT